MTNIYNTEITLKHIEIIFKNTKYNNHIYFFFSETIFLDNGMLKSELRTYFDHKDEITINSIYEHAKEGLINKFESNLKSLPKTKEPPLLYEIKDKNILLSDIYSDEEIDNSRYFSSFYYLSDLLEYCHLVVDYIDQLRKQTKINKIKTPHLNEFNKPELTEIQITILFRIFKDKKIFSNRDIDKTDFAKIISELTGYSAEKIRQKLSVLESNVLSDKKRDYNVIIDKLKEILIEAEKLRNSITS